MRRMSLAQCSKYFAGLLKEEIDILMKNNYKRALNVNQQIKIKKNKEQKPILYLTKYYSFLATH